MPLLVKLEPLDLKEKSCLAWGTKGEMGLASLEAWGDVMACEAGPNSFASIERKERAWTTRNKKKKKDKRTQEGTGSKQTQLRDWALWHFWVGNGRRVGGHISYVLEVRRSRVWKPYATWVVTLTHSCCTSLQMRGLVCWQTISL